MSNILWIFQREMMEIAFYMQVKAYIETLSLHLSWNFIAQVSSIAGCLLRKEIIVKWDTKYRYVFMPRSRPKSNILKMLIKLFTKWFEEQDGPVNDHAIKMKNSCWSVVWLCFFLSFLVTTEHLHIHWAMMKIARICRNQSKDAGTNWAQWNYIKVILIQIKVILGMKSLFHVYLCYFECDPHIQWCAGVRTVTHKQCVMYKFMSCVICIKLYIGLCDVIFIESNQFYK